MVHSEAPPRKMAATHSHTPRFFSSFSAPEAFSGVSIGGIWLLANKITEIAGMIIRIKVSQGHLSGPASSRNTVLKTTTATTPQA